MVKVEVMQIRCLARVQCLQWATSLADLGALDVDKDLIGHVQERSAGQAGSLATHG